MDTYEVTLVGKATRPRSEPGEVDPYLRNTPRFLERRGFSKVEFFDQRYRTRPNPDYTYSWQSRETMDFSTGIECVVDVEANSGAEAYRLAAQKLEDSLKGRRWCRGPRIVLDTPRGGKIEVGTRRSHRSGPLD